METIHNNLELSEKTIEFLQGQLTILTALAAQKQQSNEAEEIKRISAENQLLQKDLFRLKEELRYYEVQNGVVQVALPNTDVSSKTCSDATAAAAPLENEAVEKPVKEKETKGSKKTKNTGKEKKLPADDSRPIDASRLNMKVGRIVSATKHPDADGLFVEEVDLGEEKNRNIVSGLVGHYTLDQMQDRIAVFLCNLKPAKMRGVLSEGMIMCASPPGKSKVEILQVPNGAVVGERVTCVGYDGEPDTQLNPKKKIWEQIKPDLQVGADGVPGYKGGAFTIIGKGVCSAPSLCNCNVE